MSQYGTGTVSVTNGNAVVTGTGTAWLANISVGDVFSVLADNVTYDIASVDSDTQITLTANYAGTTNATATYTIVRDFSTNYNYALPRDGDVDMADILTRNFNKIDSDILSAATTGGAASIDDLSDVDTTGVNNGDNLQFNSTSGNWEPVASPSAGLTDVVDDATPQLGGTLDSNGYNIDFSGTQAIEPKIKDYTVNHSSVTIAAGTATINLDNGNSYDINMNQNITSLVFSNVPATGQLIEIKIHFVQDATGSRTITYPASFKFPAGVQVPLTTDANAVDILYLSSYDGGTNWYANLALNYA